MGVILDQVVVLEPDGEEGQHALLGRLLSLLPPLVDFILGQTPRRWYVESTNELIKNHVCRCERLESGEKRMSELDLLGRFYSKDD